MLQGGSLNYTERAACWTSAERGPRALMDVSPQLKDDTWRRSQAALTDVGSVTADQEFVPGLPLRTAPCSPSSSRGFPPAASCWP